MDKDSDWSKIIENKSSWRLSGLKELLHSRELLMRFVYRDFVTLYKQTVLGPIWFFMQPLIMMLAYVLVFSNIAKIPTDGIPPALFYLSGIILWNYFSESFNQSADTFNENQNIFGKVYFPRLIVPFSKLISGLIKFCIQFFLFISFYIYYSFNGADIFYNKYLFIFPVLVLLTGLIGLGMGLFFTSLTTKYRDLKFLMQFGIQILMFCTPVIYPMSTIPESASVLSIRSIMYLNPLSHIIESFKFVFLGSGEFTVNGLLYSFVFSLIIFFSGIAIFNRTEKTFIDTI